MHPLTLVILTSIARLYGRNTAYGVALNFEYLLIPSCPLETTKGGQ